MKKSLLISAILFLFSINHFSQNVFIGTIKHDRGNFIGAIKNYEKALKRKPSNSYTHYLIGNAYYQLNDFEKALDETSKAIYLNPSYAEYYFDRALIYEDLKLKEKAKSDYEKAIKLNPNLAYFYVNLGILNDESNKYDSAIINFSKAIHLKPLSPTAYVNRAYSYFNLYDYKKGFRDIKEAIGLKKYAKDELDYYYVSRAFVEINEIDSALVYINKELNKYPKNAYSYLYRAYVKMLIGDYDGSINDYMKAFEILPLTHQTFGELGDVYLYKKDYEKAIKYYNKSIENNEYESKLFTLLDLAEVYLCLNDSIKANEYFEQVITLCSMTKEVDSLTSKGYAKFRQGKFSEALTVYNLIYETNPLDVNNLVNTASALIGLKDYLGAEKKLEEAIILNKFNTELHYYLGIIKLENGDKINGCIEIKYALKNGFKPPVTISFDCK